jgi:hypothetical protein
VSIVDDLCDSDHDLTEPVYLCEMPKPRLTERMEAVEAALGLGPKRNVADWTRDHWLALSISIGTVILVIIAYLAWWQPQWAAHEHENFESNVNKLIEAKQEQPIKDIHQIQLDIAKISTRLDDLLQLTKPIAIRQLRAALSLPSKQFAEDLPTIKAAIDAAINVKLPASDYASGLRSKLNSVPATAPAYWQTVGSLVSFRSSDGSIASQFLPPCDHLSVAIIPGKTKLPSQAREERPL